MDFFTPLRQYPGWLYPGSADRDPEACPEVDGARTILEPLRPWSWSRCLREAVLVGADVWVIPYWTWAWAGLWLTLLGAAGAPPIVAVVHNPVDHEKTTPRRIAARRVMGRCSALFTHADVLARSLQRRFPGVPVAAHPIPPPPYVTTPDRLASRARWGLPEAARIALFLGLIRPYKGVDLLLDALHRLPEASNWFVVVAGEPWGDQGTRLRRLVERLGITSRVRLELRWIPEAEVGSWLAASDVVVLPYRSGSQSAVAPLAMAAGRPVVASRVGGLPEVVRDGVSGLVVDPGSADAVASALAELDDERLERLTAGARDWSRSVTWGSYGAAIEELIQRVIGASHQP